MKIGSRAKPAIPPIEAGTYFGVCIGMIDLGEQETNFNGKTRYVNQILMIFQIPSETITIDGVEEPRQLSRKFTLSTSSKGKLRPFIETWMSQKFSDDAFADMELFELIGKPAMLTIVQSETGQYSNIASAAALPKGVPAPVAKGELITFDLDAWSDEQFDKLPDWIKDLIRNSTQYKAAHLPADEVSVEAAEQVASMAAEAEESVSRTEVPF